MRANLQMPTLCLPYSKHLCICQLGCSCQNLKAPATPWSIPSFDGSLIVLTASTKGTYNRIAFAIFYNETWTHEICPVNTWQYYAILELLMTLDQQHFSSVTLNKSGRMLTEAVTSNPPLLSPQAARVDRSEIPIEIKVSASIHKISQDDTLII